MEHGGGGGIIQEATIPPDLGVEDEDELIDEFVKHQETVST